MAERRFTNLIKYCFHLFWKHFLLASPPIILLLVGGTWSETWGAPTSESSVGLKTQGYLGSSHSENSSQFSAFHATWQGEESGAVFETRAQAELLLSLDHTGFSYVEIPESYVGSSKKMGFAQLIAGRKRVQWNKLDDTWNLGIWQPRFRWDYLEPEKVGLIGAFLKVDRPTFQLVAFGSPAFLPERGAPIDYQDGSFTSLSPWFQGLPSQALYRDILTPVYYRAEIPSMSEIVSHGGVSILARMNEDPEKGGGFWAQGALSYKPINQLLIGYRGQYNLSTKNFEITLYPRVAYQKLVSIEGGYTKKRGGVWFSGFAENPVRDQTPEQWNTQEVAPSLALSWGADLNLFLEGSSPSQFSIAYLRQWGGNATDKGPDVKSMSSLEARYPFQNALSLKVKHPFDSYFGNWGRDLTSSFKLIYDFENTGNIISADFQYKILTNLSVSLGGDIISSDKTMGPNSEVDFINRYKSNDRIRGEMVYAF